MKALAKRHGTIKYNGTLPETPPDDSIQSEFEGAVDLKYRRVDEKPAGAYVTVPEITGLAFFFFIAGGLMGHATPATKLGGEFGLLGIAVGVCIGVIGREKIKLTFKKWSSRLKNLKCRSVSGSTGTNGLVHSR